MDSEFPTVDGHFWVVRDGKIIDPMFDEYKTICDVRNANWKDRDYIPAPKITQNLILGIYKKVLNNLLKEESFEKQIEEFFYITILMNGDSKPLMYCCFQNCLLEIYQRGGEIVFGSLGFKFKDKEGYWYEFGGNNYKIVKDFIVKDFIVLLKKKFL